MTQRGNKDNRGSKKPKVLTDDFAMRGNIQTKKKWNSLLPSAKAKLIADGLFTADGEITEKGLEILRQHGDG